MAKISIASPDKAGVTKDRPGDRAQLKKNPATDAIPDEGKPDMFEDGRKHTDCPCGGQMGGNYAK